MRSLLSNVAHALDSLGFGFRFGQGRQQHAGKYGDDGNDHQQLDERKT